MADLTTFALEGYEEGSRNFEGSYNPHYNSSPAGIAWLLGYWLALTSRSAPRNVKMSRGYTIHANDMLMKWNGGTDFERIN